VSDDPNWSRFAAEFATAGLLLAGDVMPMNCVILSFPKGEKFGPDDRERASPPPSAGVSQHCDFLVST
jgi:hypothetical protein